MGGLGIGTPGRIAFDRELAGFIGAKKLTPRALAIWATAHPDLADELDLIFRWFGNREAISSSALTALHPAMYALFKRLAVAILTADPRSPRA